MSCNIKKTNKLVVFCGFYTKLSYVGGMFNVQTNCLHDKLLSGNIDVKIEELYFRLHYGATVTFLLAFSLIVTTRQYVGNPIDCVHTKDIPEDVLNTYCWIHSTYTIPSAFWKRIGGQGTAAPLAW